MTISGVFRRGHPRITLTLPGRNDELEVEFIVDTGFDGDLALPMEAARELDARDAGYRVRQQADGTLLRLNALTFFYDWGEEEDPQFVEVLVTGAKPLIGTTFLAGRLLQIEMEENGDVSADVL